MHVGADGVDGVPVASGGPSVRSINWCINRCDYMLPAASPQIPYQVDIVRGCVDKDSIGALVCQRAEQVEAVAVVMAKHSRGPIK